MALSMGLLGGAWKELAGGLADNTFNAGSSGANAPIVTVGIQSDQKILIGGEFTTYNGASANYLARLNTDGTLDTSFAANIGSGPDFWVNSIKIQSDGKILVGGFFYAFNGSTLIGLARLNSD